MQITRTVSVSSRHPLSSHIFVSPTPLPPLLLPLPCPLCLSLPAQLKSSLLLLKKGEKECTVVQSNKHWYFKSWLIHVFRLLLNAFVLGTVLDTGDTAVSKQELLPSGSNVFMKVFPMMVFPFTELYICLSLRSLYSLSLLSLLLSF